MDGFVASTGDLAEAAALVVPTSAAALRGSFQSPTTELNHLLDLEALVFTKQRSGFDPAAIAAAKEAVDVADGPGGLKFLVFDFNHVDAAGDEPAPGAGELMADLSNLILRAPVVTVAAARGPMRGVDLELALSCNVMVGEEAATFSFDADPLLSVRTYALLAQKIGFVRAERLMENGDVLDAEAMRTLLLLKEKLAPPGGLEGLTGFLRRFTRRHNAAYGIYRAQRIASPFPLDRLQSPAAQV